MVCTTSDSLHVHNAATGALAWMELFPNSIALPNTLDVAVGPDGKFY